MILEIKNNRFMIIRRDGIQFVDFDEIIYLERFRQHTLLQTTGESEIPVAISLNKISPMLPDSFVRTHRSFIVNIKFIKEVRLMNKNVYEAPFLNGKSALISKRCLSALKNNLLEV
ncbi:LytTR family DNA-binding domain-containing protein [Paenibacillus chartarius]|uniref:LytTR family DNA-binding domain-containing protein n=1 Tax=Paenibacillus chartarius TaxID=747481 RepID=A0ABV6DKZ2_9BACL